MECLRRGSSNDSAGQAQPFPVPQVIQFPDATFAIRCDVSSEVLYRGMRPDDNDPALPACGSCAKTLGVRFGRDGEQGPCDIRIRDGMVYPMEGGMSVTVTDPMALPSHRRPPHMKGSTKGIEVFSLEAQRLPGELIARADKPNRKLHRSVEPKAAMQAQAYESSLHSTQPHWTCVS